LDSGYYQDENIKIDQLLFIIFQVLFTKIRSNTSPSDIQLGRNELTKTININQVIATKDFQFQILYFLPSKRLRLKHLCEKDMLTCFDHKSEYFYVVFSIETIK
jgi:hypothetical protein